MAEVSIKTPELLALLESHYTSEKWAFLPQVANATAHQKTRTADALVMGLWPSVGLDLIGFELKVSRADWRKEMQDFHKSDAFIRYCDLWYLVAPKDVAKLEEIPSTWGWLAPKNGKLYVAKAPTRNPSPLPMDRKFLAGLCRAVHREVPGTRELKAAEGNGFERGWKDGMTEGQKAAERKNNNELRDLQGELDSLRREIECFEARSGIKIARFAGHKLGVAVSIIQRFGLDNIREAAATLARDHKQSHTRWQQATDELDKLLKEQKEDV